MRKRKKKQARSVEDLLGEYGLNTGTAQDIIEAISRAPLRSDPETLPQVRPFPRVGDGG